MMKSNRHSKIIEIIQQFNINTQEELQEKLKEYGFNVTQATVSRDIKYLRLVKILSSDGKYKYSVGKEELSADISSSKFYTLFSDSVINIDYAVNLVVLKCYVGMAQAVCAAMDAIHWESVVGTIAGDDTILVATRSEAAAIDLVAHLKTILRGR